MMTLEELEATNGGKATRSKSCCPDKHLGAVEPGYINAYLYGDDDEVDRDYYGFPLLPPDRQLTTGEHK